jgi:hypothetical protein
VGKVEKKMVDAIVRSPRRPQMEPMTMRITPQAMRPVR